MALLLAPGKPDKLRPLAQIADVRLDLLRAAVEVKLGGPDAIKSTHDPFGDDEDDVRYSRNTTAESDDRSVIGRAASGGDGERVFSERRGRKRVIVIERDDDGEAPRTVERAPRDPINGPDGIRNDF